MITVGNKTHGAEGIYVGRPSPLGKPFPMQGATCAAVIRDCEDWLTNGLQREPERSMLHCASVLSSRKQELPVYPCVRCCQAAFSLPCRCRGTLYA
jgi:hypothetical protein